MYSSNANNSQPTNRTFASIFSAPQNNNGHNNGAGNIRNASSAKATTSAIARKATTVLTPDQLACIDRLQGCFDRVSECKRRDMHLGTLQQCIATFTDDADKDEPLTAGSFGVYQCYEHYTQELIYFPEKFDFLIMCIMHRICTVNKPRVFNQMLDELLLPATAALAQRIGGELLTRLIEEDEMREDDEVARVEAFCLKKDWVPRYSMNSPLRFLRDGKDVAKEAEEEEKEKKRRADLLTKSRK